MKVCEVKVGEGECEVKVGKGECEGECEVKVSVR